MADPIELDAEPEPDEESEPTPKPNAARYAGVGTPEKPLPRLWKVKDEDEPGHEVSDVKKAKNAKKAKAASESAPVGKSSKKGATDKKAKDNKSGKDGGEKSVLIEETPVYDTVEARQRLRILIGSGLTGLLLVIGFVIYRQFQPEQPPDEPSPQDAIASATTPPPVNLREESEKEGRLLYNRAHEVAKNGKTDLALDLLKKVAKSYPNTQAAIESKQALDRPGQNLPLFLDRPAVVASPNDAPPPAAPTRDRTKVLDAAKTNVASAVGAEANIVPPVNPPEAPRAPMPVTPAPPVETAVRPLPQGFHPRPGTAVHASGWPQEIVGDRDGAPMVLVPGGTFFQGRDDADPFEAPAHRVNLGTYYIDQHEVTVRQFNLYQKEAGKRAERVRALAKDTATSNIDAEEDRPVVMVTAREASDYAHWAGKRLPTEAQWEAAARTPDGRLYPWGPSPPTWARPRVPRQIDPVMSFPNDVSPYGVLDLAGNASEWTKDWFEPKYYQQFKNAPADNPAGPAGRPRSRQLVVKGTAKDWVVTKREGHQFDARQPYLGFRCVLPVEGAGNVFEPTPAPGQPASGPSAPPGGSTVPF
jgi:formylglycine-generating enzyme